MSERSRLSQVRRRLLRELKEEVRFDIGPIPPSLRRYYRQYKAGFSGHWRSSSKKELVREIRKARVVLVGDYHTLRQSQRTVLRILRELDPNRRPVRLCLEMVHSTDQDHLDRFLAADLGLTEFLEAVRYDETWGFPWEGYGEILRYAREKKIPVHGINMASGGDGAGLRKRDRHAARLVAGLADSHPQDRILALYGDLHLAAGHLPLQTRRELKQAGVVGVEPLVVLQNSETIFWKLHRRRLQNRVDVVRLSPNRYCVNSSPPWVKLHSHIFWVQNRKEMLGALMGGERKEGTGREDPVEYSEQQAAMIRLVARYFEIEVAGMDDFTVLTLFELNRVLTTFSRLPRFPELEPLLLARESLFIPEKRTIFLRGPDLNHAAEQAAVFLNWLCTNYRPQPDGGQDEFYRRVIRRALGFIGSLVVNPRRKHWHEEDHRLYREWSRGRRSVSIRDRIQREASRWVLVHLDREDRRSETGSALIRSILHIDNRNLRLVSTGLGQILGYRYYHGLLQGRVDRTEVRDLFSMKLDRPREARQHYFALIQRLRRVVPGVTSKAHRF